MPSSIFKNLGPDLLREVLDNPYEGTIIVDARGIVRHFSKASAAVFGIPVHRALGRPIRDIVPNTGLPQVLATGRAQIGETLEVNGRQVIVSRYPIKKDGQLIGAMGKVILHDLRALSSLKKRVEALRRSVTDCRRSMRDTHRAHYTFDDIKGASERLQQAKDLAMRVAPSDSPILLLGESGTGKELFAHAIHLASPRREHPFVRVNCGSIPADLFESELFGYEPGAFTGAAKTGKPGKFELADMGTIFLDEIAELPLALQVKLLRVLQEREVERLGARDTRFVDFRVIAATNKDLGRLADAEYFRRDLYYRIHVVGIQLPPLREMAEDVPLLARHFLGKLRGPSALRPMAFAPGAMDVLTSYHWPGNVRELENVIARALSLTTTDQIAPEHLPETLFENPLTGRNSAPSNPSTDFRRALQATERQRILAVLTKTGGNKAKAARLLGIHRTTLYYKLRKLGLSP